MEIDEIVAAAAKAAREAETAKAEAAPSRRKVSVYHQGLTHHARTALERVGIDDERMATAITLAQAEERAARVAAAGFDVPYALKREIAHLNEQI